MTDSTEQITDLIHFQLVVMDQTFTERIYHKTITIIGFDAEAVLGVIFCI